MALVLVNGQKTNSLVERIEFGNVEITFHDVEEGVRCIVILPKQRSKLAMAVVENSLVIQGVKKRKHLQR